jgi:hypothetical protein
LSQIEPFAGVNEAHRPESNVAEFRASRVLRDGPDPDFNPDPDPDPVRDRDPDQCFCGIGIGTGSNSTGRDRDGFELFGIGIDFFYRLSQTFHILGKLKSRYVCKSRKTLFTKV